MRIVRRYRYVSSDMGIRFTIAQCAEKETTKLKGSTVKKKRDSQSKMNRIERIEGGGEVRRVKRPMEIRTVFVAPLTIFTCDSYGMIVSIVCSRDIGDFEDR